MKNKFRIDSKVSRSSGVKIVHLILLAFFTIWLKTAVFSAKNGRKKEVKFFRHQTIFLSLKNQNFATKIAKTQNQSIPPAPGFSIGSGFTYFSSK